MPHWLLVDNQFSKSRGLYL